MSNKITVLGSGLLKRKEVNAALDQFHDGDTILFLPADDLTGAALFAADWAYAADGVNLVLVGQQPPSEDDVDLPDAGADFVKTAEGQSTAACASLVEDGTILIAWADNETDLIEVWAKNAAVHGGKCFDLTTGLAEVKIDGEPDEAQQPSEEHVVVEQQAPQEPAGEPQDAPEGEDTGEAESAAEEPAQSRGPAIDRIIEHGQSMFANVTAEREQAYTDLGRTFFKMIPPWTTEEEVFEFIELGRAARQGGLSKDSIARDTAFLRAVKTILDYVA